MKIDRLIGIIMILLQQDKITAPELAKRFEVSRRTINRDMEDICKAGIPIVATQGYGGGLSIADGYKIDKSFLTGEELQTILAGLKGIDSVSKTSYFAKLLDKLSSKGNRVIADDMIIIDLASHYQTPLTAKIETIKQAICSQHMISFRYYSGQGERVRNIEPYRLVFKWSSWYVLGFCTEKQGFRLFKLNRLWELQMEKDTFFPKEIPEAELDFDGYFTSNTIHLKALFAVSEKHRLIEEYGIDCYCVDENKQLLFEWDFASYENMREWIFSFGDKVKILEPQRLHDDRIRQAKHIVNADAADL